jgi:hypothetical protein
LHITSLKATTCDIIFALDLGAHICQSHFLIFETLAIWRRAIPGIFSEGTPKAYVHDVVSSRESCWKVERIKGADKLGCLRFCRPWYPKYLLFNKKRPAVYIFKLIEAKIR